MLLSEDPTTDGIMLAAVVQIGPSWKKQSRDMLAGNVCLILGGPTMDNLWLYHEELAYMQQSSSEKNLETTCAILREMKFKMGAS
jgi:hypothetical protein